jgi:hypothetical protein
VSNPSGGDQALPASGGTDETIDLPSMPQPNNHHNAPLVNDFFVRNCLIYTFL